MALHSYKNTGIPRLFRGQRIAQRRRSVKIGNVEELRSLCIHTDTHSCHTGAWRKKETMSKFQAASRRLYPPGLAGQNGFAHRAQKIHLHMSCLTIIIIQKGLLFIWLPSYTQSWCISQGLSDLASPQLCSTTSSRLIPAPSVGIIRRRRSPHSTLISFSTRSPCRIN